MKIGFFGDGPWAERALLPLLQDSRYTIVFVAVRASRPIGSWSRWRKAAASPCSARRRSIPTRALPRSPGSAPICMFRCRTTRFFARGFGRAAARHAELPRRRLAVYRGRNPLTWAIINGEEEFGVTVHWVDLGIDTGDIVLQVKTPIKPTDTYATLLASAEELCASTLVRAISDVHEGKDRRIVQATIDPVGMYCCRRREGDEEIDWTSGTDSIERFVRALVPPGPGARTTWKDAPYAILAAEKIDGARPYAGAAGEVIGRDSGGILVKSGDTLLRLTRWAQVQPDGSLGAAMVPNALRGQRLGRDLKAQLARAEARIALLESRLGAAAGGD